MYQKMSYLSDFTKNVPATRLDFKTLVTLFSFQENTIYFLGTGTIFKS